MKTHPTCPRPLERHRRPMGRAPQPTTTRVRRGLASAFCALVVVLIVLLGFPGRGRAQGTVPDQLSFQGYIVDAGGTPLGQTTPAQLPVIFSIFSAATGGNAALWAERQTVTFDKGNYSVMLGQGTPIVAGSLSGLVKTTSGSELYVETTVTVNGSDARILPRMRLLPTPYAFLAKNALTADTVVQVDAGAISTGTISDARLSPSVFGSVSDTRLSTNVARRNQANTFTANQTITGKLGIGATTASDFPLSFTDNTTGDKISLYGQSGGHFGFGIGPGALQIHSHHAASDIVFGHGSSANMTEIMRIKGTGNVGIGTDTPLAKLDIRGGLEIRGGSDIAGGVSASAIALSYYNGGGYRHFIRSRHNSANDNNAIEFFLNTSATSEASSAPGTGNQLALSMVNATGSPRVGINTANPAYTLDVRGDLYVQGWFYSPWGDIVYRLNRTSENLATWISDVRLKQEIKPISGALDAIGKLRGVTWHWNDAGLNEFTRDIEINFKSRSGLPEDDKTVWAEKRKEILEKESQLQHGFVAQEVEKVFPNWVTTGENGYKQINMQRLSAVLVEAIKEQQTDLDAKAARIEALEKRLVYLEAREKDRTDKVAALETLVREKLSGVQRAGLGAGADADRN